MATSISQQPQRHRARQFSVIVTVRDEIDNIKLVVESLLSQRRPPDELIIVDGASTDGTLEVLQEYQQKQALILISRECNISQGRNLGIASARYDHIAVTDAGCRIDPGWLEHIEECFDATNADVVAGNYRFETVTNFEKAVVLATESPDRENSDAARYYPSSRSVAFRKAAWQAVKGYPEWLYAAEDTLFNMRLRQLGFHFEFCREAIVIWRPRGTWKALARQHFNYSRGNGRVGIGTSGYLTNLQYHGLVLLFLFVAIYWPYALIFAVLTFARHVQRHLWKQAAIAVNLSGDKGIRWRVLAIMETVRLVGMAGFLAGRRDRMIDKKFINCQMSWMGISSLDDIPATDKNKG